MLQVRTRSALDIALSNAKFLVIPVAMLLGALAAGGAPSVVPRVPAHLLLLGLAIALAVLVSVKRPLILYGLLLAAFPLGDVVRKVGGAGPVYVLSRDVLLFAATALLASRFQHWRELKLAFRGCWLAFALCVAYFIATGAASAFTGWQVPLSGLRLYFEYVPLLILGFFVGADERNTRAFAIGLGVSLSLVTLVSIAQGVIGPEFLAASSSQEYFKHLDLYRTTHGLQGDFVFQPTGFFVETGRNAHWMFLTFLAGFAFLQVRRLGYWRYPVVVIGAAGLVVASARTILIGAVLVVLLFALLQARFRPGRVVRLALTGISAAVVAILILRLAFPGLVDSRAEFLGLSLNPLSSTSELTTRTPEYLSLTARSLFVGGPFGRGVGAQSLGRQYLSVSNAVDVFGEGGFVTIAVETGVIGLVLWIMWTARWTRRLVSLSRRTSDTEASAIMNVIASGLIVAMFVIFWLGIDAIQDFLMNAAFFCGSGLVAGLAFRFREQQTPVRIESELVQTS